MAKVGDYDIKELYQGGPSSLKSDEGDNFTGHQAPAGSLGITTDPRTANQISLLSHTLNIGVKPIEVGTIQPEHFDQIPKQHFKEMNRIAKLAGAQVSLHAPIVGVEPSGLDAEGRRPWNESHRELVERQLNDVMEKAADMRDEGGMPVTIHASNIPGTEYRMVKEGEDRVKKIEKLIVVNKATGQLAPLEEDKRFSPGEGFKEKGEIISPEERLGILNRTEWDNSISQLIFNKERADEILQNNQTQIQHLLKDIDGKNLARGDLTPTQQKALDHIDNARTYLQDTYKQVDTLFGKAYEYGTEEQKQELISINEKFKETLEDTKGDPLTLSNAMQGLITELKNPGLTPEMYVPIEKFATEKSAETFGNVAFNSFEKFKDKAPVVSIENIYTGMAFSQGKDIDKLITRSREEFVKKAKEKGYSEWVAKKEAEKLIGATLDVGHLNISRKKGFNTEDLTKEVAQIAKHVKHIHMTDNFGYSDSHLPPGMGNVPIKEMLKEVEKAGRLDKVNQINEVGGWFEHFKSSPYEEVLRAFGSPIYSMQMGPSWNQAEALQQGYLGGYGTMLPQGNYNTFGSGFSQLPMELGGQNQGAGGSRMSGRPME